MASNLVIGLSLIAYNSFYPNGAWDILLLLDFILVFISEGIIKLKGLCNTWFTEEGFLEGFLCLDSFYIRGLQRYSSKLGMKMEL